MKLKRLTLQGYKTFATRTEFLFDGAITAIVGPNGSGKSNVADSVRWVLGEQSYSTLRGKRTADMIFAGSNGRARAGLAQAVLTLDNSDGWLPIHYGEVEIGRRAYRSGENEYLLNGQHVRLRDVQELLATSGLAERTYTIIGQGLVDQALSLRADERRALFEEAAGINHYKNRRAETLRRLQETQHNLERVHDILAEIRPRLGALKRQAQRARNYHQVAADLRHLLQQWYGYHWEKARRELRQQRLESAGVEALLEEGRARVQALYDCLDDERAQAHRFEQQLSHSQAELAAAQQQLEQEARRAAVLDERNRQLEGQLAEIDQELPEVAQAEAEARAEGEAALSALTAAQAELGRQRQEVGRFEATLQTQRATIEARRRELRELEQAQQTARTRLAQTEGNLNQLRERRQERETRQSDTAEGDHLDGEIARFTAAIQAAQAERRDLEQEQRDFHVQRRRLNQQVKDARQAAQDADHRLRALDNDLAAWQARADVLQPAISGQTAHVLKTSAVSAGTTVASAVTIPGDYQLALEAAAASRLSARLLPEEKTLWQWLGRLEKGEVLTAAVADHVRPTPPPELPTHPDVIGWASTCITCDESLRPVVDLIFGRILLVNGRRSAYRLGLILPPGAMAVSLDGFVVHAGGLVEAGRADGEAGILARENAWRAAQAALAEKKAEREEAGRHLAALQKVLGDQQAAADAFNHVERSLNRRDQEIKNRLTGAERDLERARQQKSFLAHQQDERANELRRLSERITDFEQTMSALPAEVVQLEATIGEARVRLQAMPMAEAEQQRQQRAQQLKAAESFVAGRHAVADGRRASLRQLESQLHRQQARRQGLRQQLVELDLEGARGRAQALQLEVEQRQTQVQPLLLRLRECQGRLHDLERQAGQEQKAVHEVESRYTQARIALNQRATHLDNLQERIKNDLGLVELDFDEELSGQSPLPITEIVEHLPVVTELPPEIDDNIQKLRAQLHRVGAVNPDAPAEYEETQTRHDFLTQQVEDLEKTEVHLRHIIAELDDVTSRAFAETVQKVDVIFGEMFARLFGGGQARLMLTEPDDLMVTGVDIVARLPHRREQGLALLSGGERSLTAAALVFALLKVSPTPFCILDEVDAMLDEANVGRFRDAVRELSQQTQFIIITHNRGTVEVAQTIYGISMGPDSASQVLSVRPEEYLNNSRLVATTT